MHSLFGQVFRAYTSKQQLVIFALTLGRVTAAILDLVGIALVGVIVALFTGSAQDNSALNQNLVSQFFGHAGVEILLLATFGFLVLKSFVSILFTWLTAIFLARFENRIATTTFRNLISPPITKNIQFSKSEFLHGLTNSFNMAFTQSVFSLTQIISEGALIALIAAYLLFTDVTTFLVVGSVLAFSVVLTHFALSRPLNNAASRINQGRLATQTDIIEILESLRTILVSNRLGHFVHSFQNKRTLETQGQATYLFLSTLPRHFTEVTVLAVVMAILALQVSLSLIDVSTAAVFVAGLFRILASVLPLQNQLSFLRRVRVDADVALRMVSVENHEAAIGISLLNAKSIDTNLVLRVRDMSFGFDHGPLILENVNLELVRGSLVAVSGPSGAGKSTFADLLMGLLEPTDGSIQFYSDTVSEPRSPDLKAVAYVPQKTNLISGTLAENVAMSRASGEVNRDLVFEALTRAGLAEFCEQLEAGLDTVIGPQFGISGGQAQRIGLARALYSKPDFLILDEVTNALDPETEDLVSRTIAGLRGNSTLVWITHNRAHWSMADRVYELRNKTLVEVDPKFKSRPL